MSKFWQNQFLKEARRGSTTNGANTATNGVLVKPPPPPPMTPPSTRSPRPRSGSPRSPRSPAAGADGKVLWLPELMRRRSLDLRDSGKDNVRDLSLPKSEEDMVALDMSASILIQHAEDHAKQEEDDENEQALLDATPGEGPGAFPCSSCGKVYRWKRTLRNHLRSECGKEPQFQCPYCHLRSKRKSNIYAHIRVVHHKPV
ncbi:hypothetical protein FOCC_FOCC005469 [Frankliniella occidentalis]|nr:hypothetical protein FOCC_FOCC005469 [Frankliniella occidentalis]